jgi:hypothetical protein
METDSAGTVLIRSQLCRGSPIVLGLQTHYGPNLPKTGEIRDLAAKFSEFSAV